MNVKCQDLYINKHTISDKVARYCYDTLDIFRSVKDNDNKLAEYTYYPDGTIKSLKNGSLYTEYAYDADKTLTGLKTMLGQEVLADNPREGRAVGEGETAAHIVASTGTKRQWASAADSRALLTRYNIDINDAANGIPLGHPRPHNLTHNRALHENVNEVLHADETNMLNNSYERRTIRSALRRELRSIGKEFENGIRN